MDLLSAHDKAVLDTIFDPLLPLGSDVDSKDNLGKYNETENNKLDENIMRLVKEAIACVENKRYEDAIRFFDEAVDKAPHSAAVFNDRAQALRLAGRNKEALKDLEVAVELSGGCGKIGMQVLCQRGILYRLLGRNDDAKEDFTKAAKAGSCFARNQLVALNPYAAMCNAMLQKILVPPN